MASSRIPDDHITRLTVDLNFLAAAIHKPFELLLGNLVVIKFIPVLSADLGCKEFVEQLVGSTVDNQTSIVRALLTETEDTLHAVKTTFEWRLVKMRPWRFTRLVLTVRQGDVQTVKRGKQLVGSPEFFKDFQNARFHSCIPQEFFVVNTV
ncbi:hypothetical protein OGATHE_006788 [Ogataea polymorpha]|uniref:Uncharacterized protein n=1 Tax=Ogataea polymorpha TaxID=460523 RepID=A0A9P8NTF5_9ASCO|nr:hypothetical protein OGATHE_006788 [Ogataea polymorpha]